MNNKKNIESDAEKSDSLIYLFRHLNLCLSYLHNNKLIND